MLSLFQFEINSIQIEINALKTEVEKYEKAQTLISAALADLQKAIGQIKLIAPNTIIKFKEAATALFEPDTDHSSDNDGCDDEEYCDGWQDIETTPPVSKSTRFTANFEDKVGYFNTPDGYLGTCYLASNNKSKLENWGHHLVRLKQASGFEIRPAKRLINYKHELKIWGLKEVQTLYQIDTNRLPPSPDFAEINPNSCPIPKLYKIRVNMNVIFEAENYQEALEFYKTEIKKDSTMMASLLNHNYEVLERYFVPDQPQPEPDRYSPEIEAELDDIKANSEPIHPLNWALSNPEFYGLAGIA